ncbi:MAG: hypothetical protein UT53_C0042G0007 [Candidatus Yanofskybacteria bacterium GW2011_GWD2_39_48]|uniref:Glucose/sorbosone dehydrogenase n=1 Tax=Candidatus Yanofskybacteria bacterium GW2011_GWD2_39_48 TaxID=1619031 RepID=A0A0G0PB67_9BACT|nr:MAG: hypothetical protein UT53_C0042G0007 [Candidatus Yanofskybacteria bacterium GW2011_GWD2_39_48]
MESMDSRRTKQLIISAIFLLVFTVIGYGIYSFVTPNPTCFDGVKNGKEEGVDCGTIAGCAVCSPEVLPVSIQWQKLLSSGTSEYDFVALVNNPNTIYGASRIDYEISATGMTQPIKSFFYIAPGQTKYVIHPSIKGGGLTDVNLKITQADWLGIKNLSSENINLEIKKKDYTIINSGGIYSQVEGTVLNNSNFDLSKVDIGVLLFDEDDNVIAVGRTNILTLPSNNERYYKVFWPTQLDGDVSKVDVEATTNIFDNYNFLKIHGTEEQFQKLY